MSPGALIGPIIVAIGLVAAAIVFAVVGAVLQTADGDGELRLGQAETEIAVLRDELASLRGEVEARSTSLERTRAELAAVPPPLPIAEVPQVRSADPLAGAHEETEEPTEVMQIADARFNQSLTQARNSTMLEVLGQPRGSYSDDCQPVTNPKLLSLLETRSFGSFSVTMIRPALDSLERIMAQLKETEPDIHDAIGTAGALCARFIRGSRSSISNHSWGTAIDLTLKNSLDQFADGGTQFGLLLLAEAFNAEGWYWGATYSREDSMHFEVGEETLRAWQAEGRL